MGLWDDRLTGRIWRMSPKAPSADARKADGVRLEALRNPRILTLLGRVACNQDESPGLKLMVEILETMDIRMLSQDVKGGDEKAEDV